MKSYYNLIQLMYTRTSSSFYSNSCLYIVITKYFSRTLSFFLFPANFKIIMTACFCTHTFAYLEYRNFSKNVYLIN